MVNSLQQIKTPKSELKSRITRLQTEMAKKEVSAVMIMQQADKFYFSGTVQDGVIFVPVDGKPIFMVRKSLKRALEESELEKIVSFKSYSQMPTILKENGIKNISRVGLEMDVMPVLIFNKLCSVFSGSEIIDASKYIRKIRMTKSHFEIQTMKKAGEILGKAMKAVPDLLTEGMTEVELAAETEIILRKSGHQGIIRIFQITWTHPSEEWALVLLLLAVRHKGKLKKESR